MAKEIGKDVADTCRHMQKRTADRDGMEGGVNDS